MYKNKSVLVDKHIKHLKFYHVKLKWSLIKYVNILFIRAHLLNVLTNIIRNTTKLVHIQNIIQQSIHQMFIVNSKLW